MEVLEKLEALYGAQQAAWPADPYLFLVWWHCGYPASDERCARGWESLTAGIGTQPEQLLGASIAQLTKALTPGGMVPELRARRLQDVATRAQEKFGGDLRRGLAGPLPEARKALKNFPGIADPGADRILLFGGIAPLAAVPSNCPHVLVRIQHGKERENYGVNYRRAQEAIERDVPANTAARTRAYLLVKRHGQELCKAARPKCAECPVRSCCVYGGGVQAS